MSKAAGNLDIQATIMVSRYKIDDVARNLLGAYKLDRKWARDFPLVMEHLLTGGEVEYTEPGVDAVQENRETGRVPDCFYITFTARRTTSIDRFNSIIKMVEAKIGTQRIDH